MSASLEQMLNRIETLAGGHRDTFEDCMTPDFALAVVSAVHDALADAETSAALSPSTELPAIDIKPGDRIAAGKAKRRPEWIVAEDLACRERQLLSYASLLRAANAEAGRLKGEYMSLLISTPTQPKWVCFHCDFSTSDASEAAAHFGDRDDAEEFTPLCKWWMRMDEGERAETLQDTIQQLNAEREENATAHASGKLKVRKEALEAVRSERLENHEALLNMDVAGSIDGTDAAYSNAIHDAEQAILALGPVSPASDPRREQMEIDATFMCGMCAEKRPLGPDNGSFWHEGQPPLECRAAPLRAHFERQAVLALPEAAK